MAAKNVMVPSDVMVRNVAAARRVAVGPRLRERLLLRHRRKHEHRDFAELLWFTIGLVTVSKQGYLAADLLTVNSC